jgi:hypothetical protein
MLTISTLWPALYAVIEVVLATVTAICGIAQVSNLGCTEGVSNNGGGTTYDSIAFDEI